MDLLLEPPGTNMGVYAGSVRDLPARHWYFDAVSNRLVYKTVKPYATSVRDHIIDDPQFAMRVIFEDRDADCIPGASLFVSAGYRGSPVPSLRAQRGNPVNLATANGTLDTFGLPSTGSDPAAAPQGNGLATRT